MASHGGSFTAGNKETPNKSGPSEQSVQSTGMAADMADTASSGGLPSSSHSVFLYLFLDRIDITYSPVLCSQDV